MSVTPIGAPVPHVSMRDGVLPVLLAGGKGSRLHELTQTMCKPAVPFVGSTRIVDFTLRNLEAGRYPSVLVATQYCATSLNAHLASNWAGRIGVGLRHAPDIMNCSAGSRGTADAVRMLIAEIDACDPRDVLILAADHVYSMDYADMVAAHRRTEAEVTVAVDLVPTAEASAFGIVGTDPVNRINRFVEKPSHPPTAPGHPDRALASMGLYLFRWDALRAILLESPEAMDFGHHVLPIAILNGRAFAFAPGAHRPFYWRDVGTLDALRRAALDFMGPTPPFPLPTIPPPARRGHLDSLIMDGAFVSSGAMLVDCIVAPDAVIAFDQKIGISARDKERFRRDDEGTWLVTGDMLRRGNRSRRAALAL